MSSSVPLQRLHALGGEVADNNQKITHLVATKVTRTVKFLTAMSVVKHIVSPDWLEESWRSQKFVGMFVSHRREEVVELVLFTALDPVT